MISLFSVQTTSVIWSNFQGGIIFSGLSVRSAKTNCMFCVSVWEACQVKDFKESLKYSKFSSNCWFSIQTDFLSLSNVIQATHLKAKSRHCNCNVHCSY